MTHSPLPALIEQMLQPQFYPHAVIEPIELLQTHISFVLLTGDYAYKIKKPVNFGWLDYSILAQRHHFCQEEFRLNQAGAAPLYLEVLPITLSGDKFQLASPETPESNAVEYVIKMRQFPQNCLFINLFKQGKLTEKHLEYLGREVAKYHSHAATNDYIRLFGEASQIREAMEQNYQNTQQYIGGIQTQFQYEETKRYTDTFFTERQELFNSRIENNRIRECHGDLHLKNICLWHDKILLFDCIEFNEPFRFVDVMYDVAFTVMDLEARGRQDLGNVFLNTYAEQTGDWEGIQVLPLYLSRQAYVRAKVNSLLSDESTISETEKQHALASATHYYQLAYQYTRRRSGQVILMSGLSGSGKSTVARFLARRLGAIHIRSDAVRKHLGGVPLSQTGNPALYKTEMTQKTYRRLLELGIMLANQGFSIILDAKYDQQEFRDQAIAICQSLGLPLQILYCTAPIDILKKRLQERRGDIADATTALLFSQQVKAEPFTDAEQPYVKTIDTTQDIGEQLHQIRLIAAF